MSWKNVLRLYGVYNKSYRLVRKGRFRRYRESPWMKYILPALLLLFGIFVGGSMAYGLYMLGQEVPDVWQSMRDGAAALFVSLPVFAVLYSLYFTQMRQVQQIGAKAALQPIYWFPLTWEEHTLASLLSGMTVPLSLSLILFPAIVIPSYALGMLPLGLLTVAAALAGMAMTAVTSEILKGVQVRLVQAFSKRAGRATVWLRFLATLALFAVIYTSYFALNSANVVGIAESLAGGIMMAWFVPYLWPGIVLYEAYHGLWLGTAIFAAGTAVFTYLLFRAAVYANARLALQDTSVLHISRGRYAPGRGLLERLGVSPAVAAVVRKDLRAYTRRQELMYVFITPVIFLVSTIMPLLGFGGGRGGAFAGEARLGFFYLAFQPALVLAAILGASVVGSEGERLQVLTMSPLSARGLVKAKYLFITLVCAAVALASVALATVLYAPSAYSIATVAVESLLLVGAIGMVALAFGIGGADFREVPRTRTVRPLWMMAAVAVCFVLALLIALPVLAYGVADLLDGVLPGLLPSPVPHELLFAAVLISGLLALGIWLAAYSVSVRLAAGLFRQADA
ncbi:MAG TPA: hypothetical protein VLT35_05545 [Methanocella sp.]|nr:hypothetical protein [Methanocella sp.]